MGGHEGRTGKSSNTRGSARFSEIRPVIGANADVLSPFGKLLSSSRNLPAGTDRPFGTGGAGASAAHGCREVVTFCHKLGVKVRNGVQIVTVNADDAGQRVDNYLMRHLPGVPLSLIHI